MATLFPHMKTRKQAIEAGLSTQAVDDFINNKLGKPNTLRNYINKRNLF
jgi:hypothetical protein